MPDRENLFTSVVCIDKPGEETTAARQNLLAAHLEYIESTLDQIVIAGPLYADDGETIVGSLLIYKTGDQAEAQALLEADPYFGGNFWTDIHINPFFGAAGDAVGGKTW